MKIATLNVNSVRIRLGQVLDWLDRESPDVLCLQETKVQDKDFPADAFQQAGYRVAYKGQKSHAGVALVSREEPQEIHLALIIAFDTLSKRAAESQVLDGLQALLSCEAVALPLRKRAARRFLEIEKKLHNWARQKYVSSRALAIALDADS